MAGLEESFYFGKCLRNRISPVIIEDAKRSVYIEGLKDYRENADISILEKLFTEEQKKYYQRVSYFMQE